MRVGSIQTVVHIIYYRSPLAHFLRALNSNSRGHAAVIFSIAKEFIVVKKFISALLCAVAAVSFCGCGTSPEDPSDPAQNSSESSSPADKDKTFTAHDLAERALNADEWPGMDFLTTQEYVSALFSDKIILDDLEDYAFASNVISAQLNKILIVKPRADRAEAVEAAMDEYFEYVTTEGAFYPQQEASAAGSVMGKTSDGYIYMIVHENGAKIADEMLAG